MAKEMKQKRFHYRYVDSLGEDRDLETLLTKVLFHTHKKVADRWEQLDTQTEDSELRRFINKRRKIGGIICGTLVLYEAGRNREVVTLAADQEELEVQQMAPVQDDDEQRREFLEATLYFAVSCNHVVVMQTRQLSDRDLENHLRWLVAETAGILKPGEYIALKRGVSVSGTNALKQAKAIRVGAPIFPGGHYTPQRSAARQAHDSEKVIVSGGNRGIRLLQGLFDNEAFEQLQLERFSDADDLVVEVSIKRRGHVSMHDDDPGRQAMEAITSALRHQDPADVEVETHRMGTVRGDELYVSAPVRITHWNGVPEAEDVFHNMQDWLRTCIQDGIVNPR